MVSNHVQALEERLGARLLNRTTRRVGLTEVGRAYYERCTRILEELEEADQAAGLLQTTVRGTLRLFVGTHIVPLRLAGGRRVPAPPSRGVGRSRQRRAQHRHGRGRLRPRHPRRAADGFQPDRAQARRVASHPASARRPIIEKHGAPQRLEDLRQHNCLRYSLYPFGDEWQFIGPDEAQMSVKVSGNLVTNNAPTLRAAGARRAGHRAGADLHRPARISRRGWLVPLLPDHRPINFAINASYPTRHHLSTKVRAFLDLAAEHFVRHRAEINPD